MDHSEEPKLTPAQQIERERIRRTGILSKGTPLDAIADAVAAEGHAIAKAEYDAAVTAKKFAAELAEFRAGLERTRQREREMPELFPSSRPLEMDAAETALHLEAAEGFAGLNCFVDAWRTIEELPEAAGRSPAAQRIRLLILTDLHRWEEGETLLTLFTEFSPVEQREVAGRFLLAHAVACFSHNSSSKDAGPVKEMARRAVRIWPEGREEISKNPVLSRLW